MRRLLAVILVLGIAGVASAANLTNHNIIPDKGTYVGDGFGDGREGGETFATATVIPGLPYSDAGGTCSHVADMVLSCGANAAPDVFYSYTPSATVSVNVSLCGSGYDTAMGIYDAAFNEIGCNDDFCGLQSEIDGVTLQAGQTYYFDVSGYSTNCGSYTINVTENVPCVIDCPAGALAEGEPVCADNYVDAYNGGCNGTPQVFQPLCPQSGTSAVLCGQSGTFLYAGLSYRDTDWFLAYGNGETMTMTCRAAFPLLLFFIYGTNCSAPTMDSATAGVCQDVSLSRYVALGTEVWLWVGPSQFNGIACGSDYVLSVTGLGTGPLCGEVPTEHSSWGAIKNLYR
jgi:hypothetical protein